MKNRIGMILVAMLLIMLLLSACAPPPPVVSKADLTSAEQEALAEEAKMNKMKAEKDQLTGELTKKEADLKALKDYQKELGMN